MTIYFYKAADEYGCFSNFSPHRIYLAEREWPTVEHYYQAHKFLGTPDEAIMERIHAAPTPEDAAQLGRDRQRTPRPDWDKLKVPLMYEAVTVKFLSHADIQEILLDTGDERLVENSPVDYFWGCGKEGTGKNHLGRILMKVRAEIRQKRDRGELPALGTLEREPS